MSALVRPARRHLVALLVGLLVAVSIGGLDAAAAGAETTATTSVLEPPAMADPVTATISDSLRNLRLSADRDYILSMPDTPVTGAVKIEGGRNVVLTGGRITIDWQGDAATTSSRRGLFIGGQTGTVHVEGLHIDGSDLTEGIQIAAPDAVVQIENVRIEGVRARDQVGFSDNTPDLIQPWGGVEELRVDGLTGTTDYRAMMLKGDSGPIGSVSLRRIDVVGGPTSRQLLWKSGEFPLAVDDVWLTQAEGRSWETSVWPHLPDPTWSAVQPGTPPDGSFVPADSVGIGYVTFQEPEIVGGGSATEPDGGGGSKTLRWAPPALTDPSLVIVHHDNRDVTLDPTRDFVVQLPATPLTGAGGLKIQGGRNVVMIGGEISIGWQGAGASIESRRGLLLSGQTGTVHVEGLLLTGTDLSEGIQIAAPEAVVQLQNIRVDAIRARDQVDFTDNHPDLIQPWGGVKELRVDRFTGTTDYQGVFLKREVHPIALADLRNLNIHGGPTARYLLWADPDVTVVGENLYADPGLTRSWEMTLNPELPDPTWSAAKEGTPAGGDYVPAGYVGIGYTSPFALDIPTAPTVTVGDTSVTEPLTGTRSALFTVSLSKPSAATVTVDYLLTDGTATTPADYEERSGRLWFHPGQTTVDVWVPVVGDGVPEGTETFDLRLSTPRNATIARHRAVATIGDPAAVVSMGADVKVDEGSGTAAFEVKLSTPSHDPVTASFATSAASAAADVDYRTTTGTVTFERGETSTWVTIPLVEDGIDEWDERFWVQLGSPVGATINRSTASGTIVDNDATPSLAVLDASVLEGYSGTRSCRITVRLSAPSSRKPTVKWATANGTATAGSDYTAASGSFTFYPDNLERIIYVPVLGDTTREANETFIVNLSGATNAGVSRPSATCTIVNDD